MHSARNAALAVLLAAPAAAQEWSEPVVTVHKPSPGVVLTVETSRRNAKEKDGRVIESLAKVRLQGDGQDGRYALSRKQVYSGTKLVTFYRKMEAAVSGESDFLVTEQTQIGKNSRGDFKGTFLREYAAGPGKDAPATRLLVHFEPYLRVKRYSAKVSARRGPGEWPLLAEGRGDSLAEAVRAARRRLGRSPAAAREPIADFILSLWTGALAYNNPMELAQFLYPLLTPQGARPLEGTPAGPAADKAQEALESLDKRPEDAAELKAVSRGLTSARAALEGALKRAIKSVGRASQAAQVAESYVAAAKPLLSSPRGPAPSPVQGLQASARWMGKAFREVQALRPGTPEYDGTLAGLPDSWAGFLSEQRAEIFVRALYLLLITKETRALSEMIAAAGKAPGGGGLKASLEKLQQDLDASSLQWRSSVASRGGSWLKTLQDFLAAPLSALVGEAWAADSSPEFGEVGFMDAFGFSLGWTELAPEETAFALGLWEAGEPDYADALLSLSASAAGAVPASTEQNPGGGLAPCE